MQRRTRQALLIGATILFATVTPLLILYALGYRPASPRIGVLLIESIPTRADVTIDGEIIGRTPQTVTNVDSDTVHIAVTAAGYLPWEKRLPVVRGGATQLRSVRLFPKELLEETVAQSVSRFSLSPNRALIALTDTQGRLTIIDEDGTVILPARSLSHPATDLLWSPDSTMILISNDVERHTLFTLTDTLLRPLTLPSRTVAQSIAWDPRLPGRLLMLGNDGVLSGFDTSTQTPERLISNIAAFAPTDRSVVAATRAQTLLTIDLLGRPIGSPLLLPQPVQRLSATPTGAIAILFEDGQAATLAKDSALQPLANNVQSFGFSPSGLLLYVQTASNELMAYNVADEQIQYLPLHRLHLITRVSEAITHPQWFAGGEHVIYQIADQIFVTEIDTRDHAITTQIDSTNLSDSQTAVGQAGDSLFYLKRTGDKVDLIRTSLIAE